VAAECYIQGVDKSSKTATSADVSPRQVAAAFGVSESSVKRWSDQGLLQVERTPGGHRRLSVPSVLRFAREGGHALRDPSALLARAAPPRSLDVARAALLRALLADDLEAARAALEQQWRGGRSLDVVCEEIIVPALAEIGARWSRGTVEIYQERRACELVRRCLDDLGERLPASGRNAPRALGGALEGDPFSLPTAMVELVLRERGYHAQSLGTGLPAATIARAIADRGPALVWLCVGDAAADARRVVAEYSVVERAAKAVGAATVVGGRGLVPALRRQLRYSAFCDGMSHVASFVDALRR
ncbi:MAG TPA: B12-binding domain-containing protein, partial [Labilithrix sp.]|nr:B12-binding domain-containing protein [Labilithrix sp.]